MGENEKKLLDAITTQGGGLDINEIQDMTGLTYQEILDCYWSVQKNVRLVALSVRGNPLNSDKYNRGWIKRIYVSKYDPNYEKVMQGVYE